ncbi:MAG: L-serine ammonia-lyase, iron-sulfur-dependent, subunit alpha [Candidatus Diapherotrites archaeon]|nr:L-serine ammonia-lyase, iron-sulfur-dependent, subunit alpha [Candidatus Diapherotrites archaeon]
MQALMQKAISENKSIAETAFGFEMEKHHRTRQEIFGEMLKRIRVMRQAARRGISEEITTKSGLVQGNAKKFFSSTQGKTTLLGPVLGKAVAYSLAIAEVNSAMGVVVAAPTAGSCGILPGAMLALNEEVDSNREKLVNGFMTASGIGLVIAQRATFAASVAGCAAEIGASASMTAGAITEFFGGTPKQALDAAAISLKSTLGLACDPVGGLVEVPCNKRNAIGVANSFTAAELALNGVESAIPFEEVVDAMYRIGKRLPPELRETGKGGLAATPTGLRIIQVVNSCAP